MDKTIVVSVERLTRHRVYKRVIRLSTKFKAHDETNEAHVGDTVLSRSRARCRPRSAGGSSGRRAAGEPARPATRSPRRPRSPRPSTRPPTRAVCTRPMPRPRGRRRRDDAGGGEAARDPVADPPEVADNTGARTIQCIRVMGRSQKTTAGVGDVIVASVKQAIPNAAVKKGDVVRAVVVRTKRSSAGRTAATSASTRTPPCSSTTGQPARHPHLRAGRARAA